MMDGWTTERLEEWTDGLLDGWIVGRLDGWMVNDVGSWSAGRERMAWFDHILEFLILYRQN